MRDRERGETERKKKRCCDKGSQKKVEWIVVKYERS